MLHDKKPQKLKQRLRDITRSRKRNNQNLPHDNRENSINSKLNARNNHKLDELDNLEGKPMQDR